MRDNDRIIIATSLPSMKEKIKMNIDVEGNSIYWYIRFNIPLDPVSVSEKTMEVMDTDGYVMRTDISYDDIKNMIVIMPIDSYEQNVYYILTITKKVCSAKGQNLKSKIYILFKLKGSQISEFKVLKSTAKVPQHKKRPRNYEQLRASKSKVYSFDHKMIKKVPQGKLPYSKISVNIFVPTVGFLFVLLNILINNSWFLAISIVVVVVSIIFFLFQLTRAKQLSQIWYNIGAGNFNNEKYEKAQRYFKVAVKKDFNNELAEYALNKVEFYL